MAAEKYAVGIDLGGTYIKLGLVNDKGEIIKKDKIDTRAEGGPESVIKQIKKGITMMAEGVEKKIKGVGIGAPGLVMLKKGTVENPPNLPGWQKVHLGSILEKETGYKINVENDANAAAIGELIFGAGKGKKFFIMLTLGTGVGGGIIIDGKIYRGENGAAGELGHVTVNHEGDLCNCGAKGCIEAYAGNNYLNRIVLKNLGENQESLLHKWVIEEKRELSPKLIYEGFLAGDEYSKNVILNAGAKLGYGLSSIINILDIRTVIVGGGVAGFGDTLFGAMKKAIDEMILTPHKGNIEILPAQLKNEAGIMGASALVFYKS